MRDVGIFIWIALLVIGVVSSMVSNIRKQMQNAPQSRRTLLVVNRFAAQPAPSLQTPAPRSPAPPATRPRAQPAPASPARHEPAAAQSSGVRRRLFASGPELVRAVIASEVLGKPLALRDE